MTNNTLGKRSPDGRLLEWAYTREIADREVLRTVSHDRISMREYDRLRLTSVTGGRL